MAANRTYFSPDAISTAIDAVPDFDTDRTAWAQLMQLSLDANRLTADRDMTPNPARTVSGPASAFASTATEVVRSDHYCAAFNSTTRCEKGRAC